MALLLAMLRTLVDEKLEPAALIDAPQRAGLPPRAGHRASSRCSTASIEPATGELTYVNAGHMPPLLLRGDGTLRAARRRRHRARACSSSSTYTTGHVVIQPDDLLAIYSDGITEAENPAGVPFDEIGLETALKANRTTASPTIGAAVVRAVEQHTDDTRFADDLTILLLRTLATVAPTDRVECLK